MFRRKFLKVTWRESFCRYTWREMLKFVCRSRIFLLVPVNLRKLWLSIFQKHAGIYTRGGSTSNRIRIKTGVFSFPICSGNKLWNSQHKHMEDEGGGANLCWSWERNIIAVKNALRNTCCSFLCPFVLLDFPLDWLNSLARLYIFCISFFCIFIFCTFVFLFLILLLIFQETDNCKTLHYLQ